jgi:ligand-binding sensor domain-containing protein
MAAQPTNLRFDRISTEKIIREKGLSQNTIQCIMQDSKGYIWVGTWDGLNLWDGYTFSVFNMENGLSNSTIHDVLEDRDGMIWVATDDGLNRMDRKAYNVKNYFHSDEDPNSISSNLVNDLCLDRNGSLWISTVEGLNKFDATTETFSTFRFFSNAAEEDRTNWVSFVREDNRGKLWVGTRYGLHCFDPLKENFTSYYFEEGISNKEKYLANTVLDCAEIELGNILIATRLGVFTLDPNTGNYSHMFYTGECQNCISSNVVNTIIQDNDGLIWIGTDKCLDIYDPATDSVIQYKSGSSTTSLSNNDIRCLFEGADGTIWIGTYIGLNKVDRSSSRFAHYHHIPGNPNSLSDNTVYALMEDDEGLVWIGTYMGVNILDRNKDEFTMLMHDPDNPFSVSSDRIRTILQDSNGLIWIGTETNGINSYDKNTGRAKRYFHVEGDPTTLPENNILVMQIDSQGRLWVGTGKGVCYKQKGSDLFRTLNTEDGTVKLSGNTIWSIYEDQDGYIWIGTTHGLNRLDPEIKNVEYFLHDANDPASISSNRVFSIYQDTEKRIWIGTMGGGLNRYDPQNNSFNSYTEKDGLPNNVVYGIIEDAEGNLWITTNWGLAKFDVLTETFVKYDALDGVQGNEFNAGSYFQNAKGEIYIGGMNGFNVFLPAEIKINTNIPPIAITSFLIYNQPAGLLVESGDTLKLNYSENFFSFEFTALDYTNPDKNWYRYQLEGYDPDLINTGPDRRFAQYQQVNPGTYVFHVTGSNNDGVWNPEGAVVTLIIKPPWWQTWTFRILAFLTAMALGWALVYWRMKYIRKKHEIEKKMLTIEKQIFDLEQKALRLQMNPHFIFNSLNAIQNFVITNDTDKAVNYLARFSRLMRMILANSMQSYIPLKDELKALTYYMDLEKLRFDDKFEYTINLDPSIDTEFIEVPPMLLQPYIENAIIHGIVHVERKGDLVIDMKKRRDTLVCVIEDNGIGREKAAEIREQSGIKRKPRGMMITQERLELLSKQRKRGFSVKVDDLKNTKGEPSGTRVEIVLQFREIEE